jgi:hypothetical protein
MSLAKQMYTYVRVQKRILIAKKDVFEFLNHKGHELVIIRIPCYGVLEALLRAETVRGYSGSRLSIMGRQATACLPGRPCKRQRASLHNNLTTHGPDVGVAGMQMAGGDVRGVLQKTSGGI